MKIELTEELINSVLPNTLITVDEEIPLTTRLEPYVRDSVRWLESLIIGDVQLPPELEEMAVRIVMQRAVIHAIPALDLVVTPTGFGVVSADGLVPASKERIERLIASISEYLNYNVLNLQADCVGIQEWVESKRGKWYCSTFFPFLDDVVPLKRDGQDVFQVYKKARDLAMEFEAVLAEKYLGSKLMDNLRTGYYNDTYDRTYQPVDAIRRSVVKYVSRHLNREKSGCPDPHEIWHLAEPILRLVHQDKKLHKIWKDSMEKQFGVEPFKNTRKGGYFF